MNIHVTVAFISGKRNTATERVSQIYHINGEWMRLPKYLQLALELLKLIH